MNICKSKYSLGKVYGNDCNECKIVRVWYWLKKIVKMIAMRVKFYGRDICWKKFVKMIVETVKIWEPNICSKKFVKMIVMTVKL